MKALQYKEWRLAMSPVPFFFLALSGLLLIPNYPYYVTFFYNSLGIFLFFQSCRENRDVYYMMLLPVTKREMVRARVRTVMDLQLLQVLVCIPFLFIRAQYGQLKNEVGIEANTAFLGLSFVLMGAFNAVFLPMHYKNGYDLGKPFLVCSILEFVLIAVLETLEHVLLAVLPQSAALLESYALHDQLRQLLDLPGVAGIKVSDWNIFLIRRIKADYPEKIVYTGLDEMVVPGLLYGADGSIGTWINLLPEFYCKLWTLAQAGRCTELNRLQTAYTEFLRKGWQFGILNAFQELMRSLGYAEKCFRAPAVWQPGSMPEPLLQELLADLDGLNALAASMP